MEDFEEKLRALFAKKDTNPGHSLELDVSLLPSLRDSLEALLEHVYKAVLIPAHSILIKQEVFFASTVNYDGDFGDALGDGMEDRPVVALKIIWQQTPLFEYWLSFDGDTESKEASIWRKVEISRQSININNLPDGYFDLDNNSVSDDDILGKPHLSNDAIDKVGEYASFPTLDMDEAVRLVQEDFYWVCDTLL